MHWQQTYPTHSQGWKLARLSWDSTGAGRVVETWEQCDPSASGAESPWPSRRRSPYPASTFFEGRKGYDGSEDYEVDEVHEGCEGEVNIDEVLQSYEAEVYVDEVSEVYEGYEGEVYIDEVLQGYEAEIYEGYP